MPTTTAAQNSPQDTPAVSVGTTAGPLLTTAQAAVPRRGFWVQPIGGDIFLAGPNVTAATGMKLTDGTREFIANTVGQAWYAITATGTVSTRVVPVL